ncbi:CD82 antigen-like [Apostichopus japonicus]|uniref:CD82 antigen-like n=1 Tax=Stichopus japonicus TaxID=307972 RepID=UPI003AB88F28
MVSCAPIARFVLVLLNLLLFVIGALMMVAGILVIFVPDTVITIDILSNVDDLRIIFDATYLMVAAWVVVGLGVVIVVVSLCGCLGSACMSKVLLGIYIFVVIQIILVQAGVGVLIILSPAWFESSAQSTLDTYISSYTGPTDPQNPPPPVPTTPESTGWNFLQYAVGCCGINGIQDYENVTGNENFFLSCCEVQDKSEAALLFLDEDQDMKNYNYTNEDQCVMNIKAMDPVEFVNDVGCIDQLYSSLMVYGIAAIAVVSIEIFIVIIALIVCCNADSEEKPI